MAKIDGLKELLNNLRVILSIISLMIISLTSGLINRYDKINNIDEILSAGIFANLILMFLLFYILKRMSKITKEIKYTKE